MKVLMIEFFYPENTYTQELGSAMSRYMDVTIACKKHVPLPGGPAHWKGLVYEGYHSRFSAPFLYGLSLLQIAREIRRGHYDVVNIQYMRSPKYEIPFFRAMKKHCGILVNTIHTILPHEASQKDRALHQQLYDLCDLEIVHNTPCKKLVSADYHVSEEKICVIPHGVYTRGEALPVSEHRDGRTEFLMFGQMRKYKGIDVMLEALALLPAEARQRVHVTVAGPQYTKIDNTDYEEIARSLKVEDCVSFLRRHIPPEEHPALFAGTDVCLFPYKELYGKEGLSEEAQTCYVNARIITEMEHYNESYMNYRISGQRVEALNALVKGAAAYDAIMEQAAATSDFNVQSAVKTAYDNLVNALSVDYGITPEYAKQIYAIEDRLAYTMTLQQIAGVR